MQMFFTYGIFDDEANHIVDEVKRHAALEEILALPCPACGSSISIEFEENGAGFAISCSGKPLHMSAYVPIDSPPPWWRDCVTPAADCTWYWREWHSYDQAGTLHMKISGWTAEGSRWSGELECPIEHPDYPFWKWVLYESGCPSDLIDEHELNRLRARFNDA